MVQVTILSSIQSSHPRPVTNHRAPPKPQFQAPHSPTTSYLSGDLSPVPQNSSHQDYHLLVLPPSTDSVAIHVPISLLNHSDSRFIILIRPLLQFPCPTFASFYSPSLVNLTARLLYAPAQSADPDWPVSHSPECYLAALAPPAILLFPLLLDRTAGSQLFLYSLHPYFQLTTEHFLFH